MAKTEAVGKRNIRHKTTTPSHRQFRGRFFHPDLQIAFEIDGKFAHQDQEENDAISQMKIEAAGIAFVRFSAKSVVRNPEEIANLILSICAREIDIHDLDEALL